MASHTLDGGSVFLTSVFRGLAFWVFEEQAIDAISQIFASGMSHVPVQRSCLAQDCKHSSSCSAVEA